MTDLQDYALIRQGELARLLAGCATVDPGLVLALTRKLRPDDLADEHARKFLLALTPDADPLETARTTGTIREYPIWLGLACDELTDLQQAAITAADEIRQLVIMRETVAELETWLAVTQAAGRYL